MREAVSGLYRTVVLTAATTIVGYRKATIIGEDEMKIETGKKAKTDDGRSDEVQATEGVVV